MGDNKAQSQTALLKSNLTIIHLIRSLRNILTKKPDSTDLERAVSQSIISTEPYVGRDLILDDGKLDDF